MAIIPADQLTNPAQQLADIAAVTFPLACPPSSRPENIRAFIAENLSTARFSEYLASPRHHLWAVTEGPASDNLPGGYLLLITGEPADSEVAAAVRIRPTIELSKCYVHPGLHGTGTADALMAAALGHAAKLGASGIWLGVNDQNLRAQKFYAKNGFARVGTKSFPLGDQVEHDFVLERAL